MMKYLGYTNDMFNIVKDFAYNYQGVGCPHNFANINKNEKVLDVGSGLGVDSVIALHSVGENGSVVGIDIAKNEVLFANNLVKDLNNKGVKGSLEFLVSDMAKMPFADETFDKVISNGAFCLAPNKKKAFSEVFRVLKKGGKAVICTSVIKKNLEEGVSWPLCMRMFGFLGDIKDQCEEIGFKDVVIDNQNSLMMYDLEEYDEGKVDEETKKNSLSKKRVHVGSEEFKH